jgi:formylglycine-generating enzyme required for sulfatase activity
MTDCGSAHENCCTSLEVTGGTYYRTYVSLNSLGTDALDGGPTGLADRATLSGFRLDKYLVTVGRFRQFATAWTAGYTPSAGSGKHAHLSGGLGLANSGNDAGTSYEPGWVVTDNSSVALPRSSGNMGGCSGTWTASAGSQENLPIDCVNWQEAYAFCIWDGGFLPSEAEWEYAAAGGSEERAFPWGWGGSTDPGNQYAIYGCHYQVVMPSASGSCSLMPCCSAAPVGTATLGGGLWGQLDLSGEVYEWTLDWYAPYVNPCKDCADLTTAFNRVLRSGDFAGGWPAPQPPTRYNSAPTSRAGSNGQSLGFRCARTP